MTLDYGRLEAQNAKPVPRARRDGRKIAADL